MAPKQSAQKKPAGSETLKRPAGWSEWALDDDGEVDDSTITPQQRRVFGKALKGMPGFQMGCCA